ncbi:phage head closure protein [Neobacillus sp. NPDC093127]|uniref:phage head closure protein n=1 Tax=Neobacillus sp. NPDC093127 TaxID=3364296 RepID=UPI0037FFDC97
MNPGKLDKRIIFLEKSKEKQAVGGHKKDEWNDVCKVWANIKPLQGREYFWAKQVHAELTIKVTIRYRTEILPSMRIKYGERTLEIIAPPINIDEKNCFLELLCKEVI